MRIGTLIARAYFLLAIPDTSPQLKMLHLLDAACSPPSPLHRLRCARATRSWCLRRIEARALDPMKARLKRRAGMGP